MSVAWLGSCADLEVWFPGHWLEWASRLVELPTASPGSRYTPPPGMLLSASCRISLAETLRFGRKVCCYRPCSNPTGFAAEAFPGGPGVKFAEDWGVISSTRPYCHRKWRHDGAADVAWMKNHSRWSHAMLRGWRAVPATSGCPRSRAGEVVGRLGARWENQEGPAALLHDGPAGSRSVTAAGPACRRRRPWGWWWAAGRWGCCPAALREEGGRQVRIWRRPPRHFPQISFKKTKITTTTTKPNKHWKTSRKVPAALPLLTQVLLLQHGVGPAALPRARG